MKKLIFLCLCLTLLVSNHSVILKQLGILPLRDDISNLFARHGVIDLKLECDTSAFERVAYCLFKGSSESVNRLVEGLNLRDLESQNIEKEYRNYWEIFRNNLLSTLEEASRNKDYHQYECFLQSSFRDLKSVKVYGLMKMSGEAESPQELQLGDGQAFSDLFLYHRTDTNEVCVRVVYGYG